MTASLKQRSAILLSALIVLVTLLLRLALMPPWIEDRDGLAFVNGVISYSVYSSYPHWPGYPVYIWMGRLLNLLFDNPQRSLHVLSVLASSLTAIPLAQIANQLIEDNQRRGYVTLAVVALWSVLPIAWIDGSEIFSDPFALLIATTMLWCSLKTGKQPSFLLMTFILAGLMLGVRISYLPLILPAAFAVWQRHRLTVKQWAFGCLLFGLTVCLWLGWQLSEDGMRYFQALSRHLSGHYSDWGGSIQTDDSWLTRPWRSVKTLFVYGLGWWSPGLPWWRLVGTLAGLFLLAWSLFRHHKSFALRFLLSWIVPYGLWIYFGNDVDLARYYFPIVAALVIPMAMAQPRWQAGLMSLLVTASLAGSLPLAIHHHSSPPLVIQAANYANREIHEAKAILLLSGDITLAGAYLRPNILHNRLPAKQPAEATAQIDSYLTRGFVVYSDMNPSLGNEHCSWQLSANFSRPALLRSRGSNQLHIWHYRCEPSQE